MYTTAALTEAFHLAFPGALANALPPGRFSLKGGCNLRFFFGSDRYSENIDLDVWDIPAQQLQTKVMSILESGGIGATLHTYGISRILPPNIARAKQAATAQRFKVHLETRSGEDIPTRIEFSRRGSDEPIRVEPVQPQVLAAYYMPPLIVPHYTAAAAARQEIRALLDRKQPQARDVSDLHILSTQPGVADMGPGRVFARDALEQAIEQVYGIGYEQFRDTVVGFLHPDAQQRHDSPDMWDQIRMIAIEVIEQGLRNGG